MVWEKVEVFFNKHLVWLIIIIGLLLMVLAYFLKSFFPSGFGQLFADFSLDVSSAVLGGGVFAAIIKSSQFSKIFTQKLSDVIYSPDKYFKKEDILNKWKVLTVALLKPTLPSDYKMAADEISKQYLESELKYRYEGLERKYDIKVSEDGVNAEIIQSVQAKIVIPPGYDEVVMEHSFNAESEVYLKDLFINNKKVDIEGGLFKDESDNGDWKFTINLLDYQLFDNGLGEKYLNYSRICKFTTNLYKDPNMMLSLSKYVRGMVVKVRINDSGSFDLKGIGVALGDDAEPEECAEGWTWYRLADGDSLLLPGQGYTLTMVSTVDQC